MNDKERTVEAPAYDIVLAIRRKKENRELTELVFRQIVREVDVDIAILKARMSLHPGRWRIYHTVNKRLHAPASRELQKYLIDHPDQSYRIDTLFKTFLLKPECKASRNLLIDVDTKDKILYERLVDVLVVNDVTILKVCETPHGYHIVTEKFDTRLVEGMSNIEVQRDAYYLLEVVDINAN